MVIDIIKRLFYNEVMYSDRPLLVAYVTKGDAESEEILSILEEISDENLGIKVCSIDADAEGELMERLGVTELPTVVAMKNGKIKARAVGVTPKAEILKMLEAK